MATNGNINHVEQQYTSSSGEPAGPTPSTSDSTPNSSKGELPKDEVGWYFVEQYYTTLSKNPEKLHLFYGKDSQFVYGLEAEISHVALGRQKIQGRIKELKFQDCKVRISNVDSQGSGENIVIQVIGETSNTGEEPKKFVQTFVLAQQPSGYFVLNDILRYINDFADDEVVEPEQQPTAAEPVEVAATPEAEVEAQSKPTVAEEAPMEQEPVELDTDVIDKKLEEVEAPAEETSAAPEAVELAAEATPESVKDEPASESIPDPEKVVEEVAEEEVKKPEDPKAPTPTPTAAPVARVATPVAAEPEKTKEPPKAMSWASRVAAAAGPTRPVVPLPKFTTPPTATQSRPPVAAAAKQPAAASPTAAPTAENTPLPTNSQDPGNEWQTAETKRQNRGPSQTGLATPTEKEGTMAYIKYVTEKVKDDDLQSTLATFGELQYFDINRAKNCAFVEFKTQAGYNSAIAANPHTVNGESIMVEQRRPKANAYGGANFNPVRGGTAGRGRGGFEPGRTNSQGGGRGGFSGQTRGGRGGAPRGRGAPAPVV